MMNSFLYHAFQPQWIMWLSTPWLHALKVIKSSKFDYSLSPLLFGPHNKFSPASRFPPVRPIHIKQEMLFVYCTHFQKRKNEFFSFEIIIFSFQLCTLWDLRWWFVFLDVENTKWLSLSLLHFHTNSSPNLISLEDKLFGLNSPAFKGTGPNLIEVHRNISQEQYKS